MCIGKIINYLSIYLALQCGNVIEWIIVIKHGLGSKPTRVASLETTLDSTLPLLDGLGKQL